MTTLSSEIATCDPAEDASDSGRGAVRVALLTDADVFAGTERHILELARALCRAGAEVVVACPAPSPLADGAAARGLRVLPCPKQWPIDRAAILGLRRLLASGEVDLVHSHNGRAALTAALATLLAGRGRCVATQHFLSPTRTTRTGIRGAASRLVHRWLGRRTNGFIAVSSASRDAMAARGEAPGDRVALVPNGIGEPVECGGGVDGSEARNVRRELGVEPGVPLVVCAARLESEKDVACLIRAMRRVADLHPSAVCVIAGQGTQEAALRRLIADLGLGSIVRLLGFRPDVLRVIAAGDVFALPSPAEPFGLVLLEAMALGRPVVATRAGGPAEIVADGATGLLVPPGDPDALAAALARLLGDPAARREMGRAGRERWRQQYTDDRMAAQTLALYRRVLAGDRGEAASAGGRP